jgi:hypothetical protein
MVRTRQAWDRPGKIKAKSKILLTDACPSGAITPEDTRRTSISRFGDLS